jgi:hypothetical protein
MFRTKLWTESKHTFYVQQCFVKNRAFCEIMWRKKNCTARQTTDDKVAPARFMLDTHKHSGCVILTAFPLQQ